MFHPDWGIAWGGSATDRLTTGLKFRYQPFSEMSDKSLTINVTLQWQCQHVMSDCDFAENLAGAGGIRVGRRFGTKMMPRLAGWGSGWGGRKWPFDYWHIR